MNITEYPGLVTEWRSPKVKKAVKLSSGM